MRLRTDCKSNITISTVDLMGIDHPWGNEDGYFYETCAFQTKHEIGEGLSKEIQRYKTANEASAGHAKWVFACDGQKVRFLDLFR